jgi:HAD superfamily hydrolase (TIGR01509 family)
MAQFRGLLCDLDGTLADSEPLHCQAWLQFLKDTFQFDYDHRWFEQWIGTSDRVVAAWLIREHQLTVDDDFLVFGKQGRFHQLIKQQGRAFPGITEVLAKISGRYPLAIATNSGRADTDVVVPALQLDRFTEVVVTATDVVNLKPAPDIYLLAAKLLDLAPENCLAIEDSGPGGEAAKQAGCYLIGLNDGVRGADEIIPDHATALSRALELLGG